VNAHTVFCDVDTQVDFMLPGGALYIPGAEALAANAGRLNSAARGLGVTLVHTADDHTLADAEIAVEGADFVTTFPPHCLQGSGGARRLPETAAAPGALDIPWAATGIDPDAVSSAREMVLRKNSVDPFSVGTVSQVFDVLSPARAVVYGVALDLCDAYLVEGLLARGVADLVVVGDAVAAVDPARAETLLADWRRRGVRVLATDEVLAESGAPGAAPA
jgi:nicotinamidase/pyrazinamidase